MSFNKKDCKCDDGSSHLMVYWDKGPRIGKPGFESVSLYQFKIPIDISEHKLVR